MASQQMRAELVELALSRLGETSGERVFREARELEETERQAERVRQGEAMIGWSQTIDVAELPLK